MLLSIAAEYPVVSRDVGKHPQLIALFDRAKNIAALSALDLRNLQIAELDDDARQPIRHR